MAKIRCVNFVKYRGIKNLSIDGLKNINLILGSNNCGKTSFLEAIQLLSTVDIKGVCSFTRDKNAIYVYDNFVSMFQKKYNTLELDISGWFGNYYTGCRIIGEKTKRVIKNNTISYKEKKVLEVDAFEGEANFIIDNKNEKVVIHELTERSFISNHLFNTYYSSPYSHFINDNINEIVANVELKKLCLELLKKFDENIIDILYQQDMQKRSVEYIKHKEQGLVPLYSFGDGIKKAISMVNAIYKARTGVLMFDEIETSLHKSYFKEILEFIFYVSKVLDIQLFITTHNIEVIDTILELQNYHKNQDDDVLVITLKKEKEKTRARVLAGKDAYENRKAFEFEARL